MPCKRLFFQNAGKVHRRRAWQDSDEFSRDPSRESDSRDGYVSPHLLKVQGEPTRVCAEELPDVKGFSQAPDFSQQFDIQIASMQEAFEKSIQNISQSSSATTSSSNQQLLELASTLLKNSACQKQDPLPPTSSEGKTQDFESAVQMLQTRLDLNLQRQTDMIYEFIEKSEERISALEEAVLQKSHQDFSSDKEGKLCTSDDQLREIRNMSSLLSEAVIRLQHDMGTVSHGLHELEYQFARSEREAKKAIKIQHMSTDPRNHNIMSANQLWNSADAIETTIAETRRIAITEAQSWRHAGLADTSMSVTESCANTPGVPNHCFTPNVKVVTKPMKFRVLPPEVNSKSSGLTTGICPWQRQEISEVANVTAPKFDV